MKEYESNSHKSRELAATEQAREKRVEKVVSGPVKTRDNKGRKLADIFISEDAANVKSYIFMDVLVPAIKKAISDIVTDGVDMVLYGSTGGRNKRKSDSKVSYRSYYNDDRFERERKADHASRNRFDYDDIVYESRREAEAVLKRMNEVLDEYKLVTVADMYDMADLSIPYTGYKYGWTNLRTAEAVRVRDGYILKLPKASPID